MSTPLERDLLAACERGSLALVRRILAKGSSSNNNSINCISNSNSNSDSSINCISSGNMLVNARDLILGNTPLLCAAHYGHLEIVKLIVSIEGVDINAVNKNGTSSLIAACYYGHEAIAELLIDSGANLELVDRYGDSALLKAADSERPRLVLRLLLRSADVRALEAWIDRVDAPKQAGSVVNLTNRVMLESKLQSKDQGQGNGGIEGGGGGKGDRIVVERELTVRGALRQARLCQLLYCLSEREVLSALDAPALCLLYQWL